MSGDRIINTGGGPYNESIQGNFVNIQGNYININQDLFQIASHIQQRLAQLQSEKKLNLEEAQQIVAHDLATQAKTKPDIKHRLIKLGQYLGNATANGLIGEAVVDVVKLALGLAGISLP